MAAQFDRRFRFARFVLTMLGVMIALGVLAPSAQAASVLEKNFYLFGPRYDGNVSECDRALHAISAQFAEKESTFWNSKLEITGFAEVHEVALRPWSTSARDTIPRRFCTAHAMLNDGIARQVHFSIIEDGGFAAFEPGVEWCVAGLDRNWAYNPSCKAARP